jgi:integrase/recombinase XerD
MSTPYDPSSQLPAAQLYAQPPQREYTPLDPALNAKVYSDPLYYAHPWSSMGRYAQLLALRYDAVRTRHSYYRHLRLYVDYFQKDPLELNEDACREYLLGMKMGRDWRPKTLRQAIASIRLFYAEVMGIADWQVFGQVQVRDHDVEPVVMTPQQVCDLIEHIRLRRYRTPIKLIYCCGLRLSECLGLRVKDILGKEQMLCIRGGKGGKDRRIPLPKGMLGELRSYWAFHRHPVLLFPNAGRGDNNGIARRMRRATKPMPQNSLQRLLVVARKELNLPEATPHTLRHSFATHMIQAGAHVHTVQRLLGHAHLKTTEVYLHLTHQTEKDALSLMDGLYETLPR